MTIASEITRLQNDKAAICAAIENKWVTVGNVSLDSYAACIDDIKAWWGAHLADIRMIGGGWGWWWGAWQYWWWGGWWGGAVCYCKHWFWDWMCIEQIGSWWAWGGICISGCNWWCTTLSNCPNWCYPSYLVAYWGGGWGTLEKDGCCGWWWGWGAGSQSNKCGGVSLWKQGGKWWNTGTWYWAAWWAWWWADCGCGGEGCNSNGNTWGAWGNGVCLCSFGVNKWFAGWWWGGACSWGSYWAWGAWWWGKWWWQGSAPTAWSCCGAWWWGGGRCVREWCAWAAWIVFIRYAVDWSYWFTCATWWQSCYQVCAPIYDGSATCACYCIHEFTSPWYFCVVS